MPLGAIIARESVMRWGPGSHGTTFGGNPVCIAAALATMELIESEYKENAQRMGDYLFGRLADWTKNFKIVGDVRGRGLMIGIEIEQTILQPRVTNVCMLKATFLLPTDKFPYDLPYGSDLDNLLKLFLDALNEKVFSGAKGKDSRVISLTVMKTMVSSSKEADVHLEILPVKLR